MNDNPCYHTGALWITRTKLVAYPSYSILPKDKVNIPRGETILLLNYEINRSYEEHIMFLWNEQVYFSFDIDSGFSFILNPNGVNTKNRGLNK